MGISIRVVRWFDKGIVATVICLFLLVGCGLNEQSQRENVVTLIKTQHECTSEHRNEEGFCTLRKEEWRPLALDGEVKFKSYVDGTVKVLFENQKGMAGQVVYVDYIYTNNKYDLLDLENQIVQSTSESVTQVSKVKEHWYRVKIQ